MRTGTALIVAALCAGCVSSPTPEAGPAAMGMAPQFEIAGVELRNELAYRVTGVQVLVPQTGEFVSCGTVFPGTACSTSFPSREYRGNPISVTWEERGQPQSVDEFVLDAPTGLEPGQPVWLQIVIFAPGNAGARLLSEPQGPR